MGVMTVVKVLPFTARIHFVKCDCVLRNHILPQITSQANAMVTVLCKVLNSTLDCSV